MADAVSGFLNKLHLQLWAICFRPVDMVELATWLVDSLVSVGTEVVALGLQEILR